MSLQLTRHLYVQTEVICMKAFLKRKNIVFSAKRYGIDALGAMASGLFCTLLVGTILNTIGQQLGIALFE